MVLSKDAPPRIAASRRSVGRPVGRTSLAMELQAAGHEMRDAGLAIAALNRDEHLGITQISDRLVVRGEGYIKRGFDDAA